MFHVCQQSRHNKTHHHNGNVDVLNITSEAYYETPPDHRMELAWLSGNVMDYHATARGSIPGRNGVFIELHVLRKGQ